MRFFGSVCKMAFRNLLRNRRRSAVTVLAAMLGFAAINVLAGFANYLFGNLRESFVYGLGNGHIIVCKQGYREQGVSNPAKFLLPGEVYQSLVRLAGTDDRILLASGRLELTGQVDTGNSTNIFLATAITPSHAQQFFRASKNIPRGDTLVAEGKPLTDEEVNEIGITGAVRRTLRLDLGSNAVLMVRTLEGQINTAVVTVKNIFDAPNESLDGNAITMPLALAQELYQTESVGSVSFLLRDGRNIQAVEHLIREQLGADAQDYCLLRWDRDFALYRLTHQMFNLIFGIVFLILLLIVAMFVMNTMAMAVLERTTEIGTLRAVGSKRSAVIQLFALEGAWLGMSGVVLGTLVSILAWAAVRYFNPTWIPPTLGREVPLELRLSLGCLLVTGFALVGLTVTASAIPARRAAWQSIPESLAHV